MGEHSFGETSRQRIDYFTFPILIWCECFVQIRKMSFREIGIDKSSGTASYIASQMVWTMSLLWHRQPFVKSLQYSTVQYSYTDATKEVADLYKCQAHWCLKFRILLKRSNAIAKNEPWLILYNIITRWRRGWGVGVGFNTKLMLNEVLIYTNFNHYSSRCGV